MDCSTIDCPNDSFILFKFFIVFNELLDYWLSEGLVCTV